MDGPGRLSWGRPVALFPERGGDGVKAKAICAGCPVRAECLDYALADVELRGTWGGTSPGERKALRRGIAG